MVRLHRSRGLLPACFFLALNACGRADEKPAAGGHRSGGASTGGSAAASGASAGPTGGALSSGGSNGGRGPSAGMSSGAASGAGAGGSGASSGAPVGGTAGGSANGGTSGAAAHGGATSGSTAGSAGSTGGTKAAGMGGEAPTGGAGGSGGTPDICSFELTGAISPEIATVGVIDWSTDLEGLSAASIEFSLDDPEDGELNLGSGGPISVSEQRALMLGLKPERSYTYRLVAHAGATTCVSKAQTLVTRADPDAPVVTRTAGDTSSPRENGFILACGYLARVALIVDSDGDVVWWFDAPDGCSRAHLDWDGEYLWTLAANPTKGDNGEVTRVRMDGTGVEQIPGLERSHHDFAVLPGGATAFLVWDDAGSDQASYLVERSASGTLENIVRLDDARLSSSDPFHANALRYYARDDSYTVSDLKTGITQRARDGEVLRQLSAGCPGGASLECASASNVRGNHGHYLAANGNLLFFSALNGSGRPTNEPAPAYEYSFGETGGALTATLEWTYVTTLKSTILGDVERLPNGNTLVTYSVDGAKGTIHEVSPTHALLQSLSTNTLGYTSFRKTLYGPPQ